MQQIKIEVKKSIKKMRYYTYGDYYLKKNGDLKVEVINHGRDDYNYLLIIHELLEYFLLQKRNASIAEVEAYDIEFESDPKRVELYREPGADPTCPYKVEHDYANKVVKELCDATGLDFEDWLTLDVDE
jgi:hypothetical protein